MGKKWKQWQILFPWAPKSLQNATAAMKLKDTCPWKRSYDQPRQHTTKQRDDFANKYLCSLIMVFPIFMYVCESWTIKKAKHQRIDAFELWYWRRFLSVPSTTRDQTS